MTSTPRQVIVRNVSQEPATPRPAATILLLRRGARHGDSGVEVLMVRRSTEASFMPGVWVFPGGIVEPGESRRAGARPRARRGGRRSSSGATPSWSPGRAGSPPRSSRCASTPTSSSRSPARTRKPRRTASRSPTPGWFEPRAALDAHAADELDLVFPTIKTLETLLEHETVDAVIEAARGARRPAGPAAGRGHPLQPPHRAALGGGLRRGCGGRRQPAALSAGRA